MVGTLPVHLLLLLRDLKNKGGSLSGTERDQVVEMGGISTSGAESTYIFELVIYMLNYVYNYYFPLVLNRNG